MPVIKPIPNMPGYGASKGGWIYSCKNGKYGFKDTWFRRLKPCENNRTHYLTVALMVNGRVKTCTIHQLVAVTWIGEPPVGKEVNHIDGNKHNNRVANLEYVTRQRNLIEAHRQGLSRVPGTILTQDQVLSIRHQQGKELQSTLAQEFGVSEATISDIHCRKTWRHI